MRSQAVWCKAQQFDQYEDKALFKQHNTVCSFHCRHGTASVDNRTTPVPAPPTSWQFELHLLEKGCAVEVHCNTSSSTNWLHASQPVSLKMAAALDQLAVWSWIGERSVQCSMQVSLARGRAPARI
jgi:hypothetical protein